MRIAVVGGGAGGLLASLLLARGGHELVVVEQERFESAPDVESAARSAFRASAPQIVQPHVVMAKFRELLAEFLPDVYQEALSAGVADVPLSARMPPTLDDLSPRPGDERLTTLATRRSTIDWVLRRVVSVEPNVTVREGVRVTGLLARSANPPHVTGLRTSHGDIRADLVVDAAGRRSPVERWLTAIGTRPPATWRAECGKAYFSRHFRVRPGAQLPGPSTSRVMVALDEFTVLISGADNGVMQLAVVPLAIDRRFRTLEHPDVHTAVMRTVPMLAPWLDGLEPITAVFIMGGLHNTMRRLVVDGAPVVTGLHAIGDSVCTTNPTLARGLALALHGAVDLVTAIDHNGEDWPAQARELDAMVVDHIVPFYEDQAVIDAERLAMLRHNVLGARAPDPPPAVSDQVTFTQLGTAAMFDPTAFRGFWQVQGMMRKPQDVYRDPQVVACTQRALAEHAGGQPLAQPTRAQLLAALAR